MVKSEAQDEVLGQMLSKTAVGRRVDKKEDVSDLDAPNTPKSWAVQYKRTFLHCVDNEDLAHKLGRSKSAPALLVGVAGGCCLETRAHRTISCQVEPSADADGIEVDSARSAKVEGRDVCLDEQSVPFKITTRAVRARGWAAAAAAAPLFVPIWGAHRYGQVLLAREALLTGWPSSLSKVTNLERHPTQKKKSPAANVLAAKKTRPKQEEVVAVAPDPNTTVMLRNVPNDYTREMLCSLLDSNGFESCYNFLYMPIDLHKKVGVGYAFVNMVTHEDAERAVQSLQGFTRWEVPSLKVLDMCWGEHVQGLEAHTEHFRNSPVMHADVPESFKPLVLKNGQPSPFPEPTKHIRRPRLKHGYQKLETLPQC